MMMVSDRDGRYRWRVSVIITFVNILEGIQNQKNELAPGTKEIERHGYKYTDLINLARLNNSSVLLLI